MDRPNLNLVIFDDEQDVSTHKQMKRYTSQSTGIRVNDNNESRSQKSLKKQQSGNLKPDVIFKQITQLQNKIKSLQKQGDYIRNQLTRKTDHNSLNIGGNHSNINQKQLQHVLFLVQKKLQLFISESNKIILKINDGIEKKLGHLNLNNIKNNPQSPDLYKNQIIKLDTLFRHKVQQHQRFYKNQIQRLSLESRRKQQFLLKRVGQLEQSFTTKLNSFSTKQKEYVDWIHHLQARLRQRKNKKAITITQSKPTNNRPNTDENMHVQTVSDQFSSNLNKLNVSNDPNTSKMARKHKIFGNSRETSVTKTKQGQGSPPKDLRQVDQPPYRQEVNYLSKKNEVLSGNLGFFKQLRGSPTSAQFYRNIPQTNTVGWDKFADMNQYSQQYEQISDDFFMPIDTDDRQRVLNNIPLDSRNGTMYSQGLRNPSNQYIAKHQNTDKVFSPFDLN